MCCIMRRWETTLYILLKTVLHEELLSGNLAFVIFPCHLKDSGKTEEDKYR